MSTSLKGLSAHNDRLSAKKDASVVADPSGWAVCTCVMRLIRAYNGIDCDNQVTIDK